MGFVNLKTAPQDLREPAKRPLRRRPGALRAPRAYAAQVAAPDLTPLMGLRIRTPRLELRLPTAAEITELATVAEQGVHPPGEMPFLVPWTDGVGTPSFRDDFAAFHHGLRDAWTPAAWNLECAAFLDGRAVGVQGMHADAFAERRTVITGSWLGAAYQGQGLGTELRTAILHLAFAGLHAAVAESGAFLTNPASARVSEKLGYEPAGESEVAPRGTPVRHRHYRLTAAAWRAAAHAPVELTGLAPCLPLFGL